MQPEENASTSGDNTSDRMPQTDHSSTDPGMNSTPRDCEGPDKSVKPRRFGLLGLALLVSAVLFFGFLGLMFIVVLSMGRGSNVVEGYSPYQETVIRQGEGWDADKIALISLSGVIAGNGSYASGEGTVYELGQQFRQAAQDDAVKAVIIQVDSPGGGLSASDILYNEVIRLKKRGKVVVVLVGSMAASGGYYVAAPADWIIAGPTSMVGSFGVIWPHFVVEDLIKDIGIKYDPIKTAQMKDIGTWFRDMTDAERAEAQSMLEHAHQRFIDIIADHRSIDRQKVTELANGTIYTADEAKEYNLIDQIGYLDKALTKAEELAGIYKEPSLVTYEQPFSLLQSMLGAQSNSAPLPDTKALLGLVKSRGPMALWSGGTTVSD